jgi:predicted O-methyltransferase YrrM
MPWYGSHPYLNEYISEKKCKKIMEIGIYDGENALNMVEAAVQNFSPQEVEYYGFDFFSYYSSSKIGRKLEKTSCKFRLFEGNTLDTLPEAVNVLPEMDLIFIDGGKSFSVAVSDWENCKLLMHDETGVFVHNADFSGVRRMIENIPRDKYHVKIFHVPSEGSVALIKRAQVTLAREMLWTR